MSSRNTELEKTKILFQFILMLVASVIGGICFSGLLGEQAIFDLTQCLSAHFNTKVTDADISFLLVKVIRTSLIDLCGISVIFVFSFSFINYMITDLLLVFFGFKFGLNASVIAVSGPVSMGIGNSLSYWLIKCGVLVIILICACKMAVRSLDMKRHSSDNGRLFFYKSTTFMLFIDTLVAIGAVLICNTLYCIFIYFL